MTAPQRAQSTITQRPLGATDAAGDGDGTLDGDGELEGLGVFDGVLDGVGVGSTHSISAISRTLPGRAAKLVTGTNREGLVAIEVSSAALAPLPIPIVAMVTPLLLIPGATAVPRGLPPSRPSERSTMMRGCGALRIRL